MKYRAVGLPWRSGIGMDVSGCETSIEVMEKAKLDFNVAKCELVAKMPFSINGNNTLDDDCFIHDGNIYRECENAFATYRTDYNVPLGVVKQKYEIVQNTEAFRFFDEAIEEGGAEWVSAGIFGLGHKIFIIAKLKYDTNVNGDPIDNYLVFSNSHDGSQSIDIMFTPIRVFCTNCLAAGFKDATSHIKFKHTSSAKSKLEEASRVLHIACNNADNATFIYNSLACINKTDVEVKNFLAKLILTPDELHEVLGFNQYGIDAVFNLDRNFCDKVNVSTRKANQLYTMFDYYKNGVAQQDIVGTAWGVYNAVTGYYSNVASITGEKRMNSLLYGNANKVMTTALQDLALNEAA